MRIWLLQSKLDDGYEDLQLVNFDDDHDKYFNNINQPIPIADKWGKVEVYTLTEGDQSDFPHFWGSGDDVPIFSERALNVVYDLIEVSVEVLPLNHPQHNYFVMHVLNAVDAIDYDKAIVRQLESGLRVSFTKYSFIPEKIIDQHIFKVYLDDSVFSRVFVSDEFKERVTSSSLVGYDFVEVWDSEKSDS
ncbi:imm11 family protein [Desmospora activa]|uniref:Immunity MXAN-0049 protein domain-containing protein n=1 Tax=Desmospora activa DSM 45169 TaxID=1121389 RepID=A0A2T4Z6N4_9BACL|nr:DUF1629 domain-containing protein [Desmospora activa]PTM57553.1 hypothetical protein C8J48_0102 [Desmospora activa DSM 45169]